MTFGKASGYSEVLSSSFTQTVCYRQHNIRLPFLYLSVFDISLYQIWLITKAGTYRDKGALWYKGCQGQVARQNGICIYRTASLLILQEEETGETSLKLTSVLLNSGGKEGRIWKHLASNATMRDLKKNRKHIWNYMQQLTIIPTEELCNWYLKQVSLKIFLLFWWSERK